MNSGNSHVYAEAASYLGCGGFLPNKKLTLMIESAHSRQQMIYAGDSALMHLAIRMISRTDRILNE
mgnify:CR=1 FL=1